MKHRALHTYPVHVEDDEGDNVRVVTNEDVKRYEPLIEKFLRDNVIKNWNEANLHHTDYDVGLGNAGCSIRDIRQQLFTELIVALQKYDPDYRTEDGRPVKEITFVYKHLWFRCGQLMQKLTGKRYGYGVWMQNLESTFDNHAEESYD